MDETNEVPSEPNSLHPITAEQMSHKKEGGTFLFYFVLKFSTKIHTFGTFFYNKKKLRKEI